MVTEYKTITQPSEGLYKEKGSKFIAYAFPFEDEAELKECIDSLKPANKNARHFCYAYQVGANKEKHRANDDGEPSGTAGLPILGQINSFELTNVLIVVVRYFGGTKLGASGLINAYKLAAQEALNNTTITTKEVSQTLNILFTYNEMSAVMRIAKQHNLSIISQNFEATCSIKISVPLALLENVTGELNAIYPKVIIKQ